MNYGSHSKHYEELMIINVYIGDVKFAQREYCSQLIKG